MPPSPVNPIKSSSIKSNFYILSEAFVKSIGFDICGAIKGAFSNEIGLLFEVNIKRGDFFLTNVRMEYNLSGVLLIM